VADFSFFLFSFATGMAVAQAPFKDPNAAQISKKK
jgi:hypothetical protein